MKHQNIIYLQQDITGVQEFKYDSMGSLIQNRHTYVVPNSAQAFTLITQWRYDSWNRIDTIIYPDNEIVKYTYNKGGLLKGIKGTKYGVQTTYIRNVIYDRDDKRVKEEYGNGTKTRYVYEPLMQRMDSLITIDSLGLNLLKDKYTYYNTGDIQQIRNTGIDPYTHTYTYDKDHQLTAATGSGTWDLQTIPYNLSMTYSPSGKITDKNLSGQRKDNSGTYPINYCNSYKYYNTNNPSLVRDISDAISGKVDHIEWDVKGNIAIYDKPYDNNKRYLCWTEDNRLEDMKDYKMGAYYNYNASGERNLKLTGNTVDITQNGVITNIPVLDQQTLYASALITVNDKGYTKHYFEEGKRICSKIGGGKLNLTGTINPINANMYTSLLKGFPATIQKSFNICIGIEPQVKNQDLYTKVICPNILLITAIEPGFYYHSDHLGSSSYITGDNGQKTQALANLPFGEDWVDLKYNSPQYTTPYKFNGKEKDEETSYNYYGARYYWSEGGIFISTDPMSDKYPHLSSYAYCANNPIMLIDPNGMNIDDYFTNSGKYLGSDRAKTDNVRIIDEGKWNDIKTTNNDGSETVNHYVGYANSSAHSEAGLTEDASLNIYEHYNSTDLKLTQTEGDNGEYYGMQIEIKAKGDKIASASLSIKVNGNNKGIKTGDHANEIKNMFVHEKKGHLDYAKELGFKKYVGLSIEEREKHAVETQMKDQTWGETRPKFQKAMKKYGGITD